MKQIRLGKTELMVSKPGFGCLPIQRCTMDEADAILRRAYEGGINFFDSANAYTDSEAKLGHALSDVRENIILATKGRNKDRQTLIDNVENCMRLMHTDYIDLFQLHNVSVVPDPNDKNGAMSALLEMKEKGYVRHIGVTTHKLKLAFDLIDCGMFETLQFPLSYLSSEEELQLVQRCKDADMGYIAMKGLAGGLLTNVRACHAFMGQFDNVVPIWGIQRMTELEQWLAVTEEDPKMDDEIAAFIEQEKAELKDGFCRGCGYCMPCPVGIEINNCARMNMLLRRAPWKKQYSEKGRAKMEKINDCLGCGKCKAACPYGLDTPNLLKFMLKDYHEFYEAHKHEL